MTLDSSHFQLVVYQRVIVTRYGKEVGMENGCGIKDPNSTRVYVVVSLIMHRLDTRYFSNGRKAPLKHRRCFFFCLFPFFNFTYKYDIIGI